MKKLFALGMFLSFTLWGCSDDSSSVSSESTHGAFQEESSANSSAETQKSSASKESSSSAGTESSSSVASEPSSSAKAVSSDDQTSQLPGTSSGTSDVLKSGFVRGKCMNNSMAKAASSGESTASEKLPEAVLGYAGGEPFIEISGVSEYCDLEA